LNKHLNAVSAPNAPTPAAYDRKGFHASTVEATFTRSFWFIRLGRLETNLEFNPCAAPEGWFSVALSGIAGGKEIDLARLTLQVEDTMRSAKHFAVMRRNVSTIW